MCSQTHNKDNLNVDGASRLVPGKREREDMENISPDCRM